MRNLKLFNPHIVYELYSFGANDVIDNLPDEVTPLLRYFREGWAEYEKHHKLSGDEMERCLDVLQGWRTLADDMATLGKGAQVLVTMGEYNLNVSPLYEYLEETDLRQLLNTIQVIRYRMIDMIHASNFTLFKDCYATVDKFEDFFKVVYEEYVTAKS